MKSVGQNTYIENPDTIFDFLISNIQNIYNIKKSDPKLRHIDISVNVSFFSFGEHIEIFISAQKNNSIVQIKSNSKVLWNISSNTQKKIDEIFTLLDNKFKNNH